MKSVGLSSREWASWSHSSYLSGEMRLGDIVAHERVWNPIMFQPMIFQGAVGALGRRMVPASGWIPYLGPLPPSQYGGGRFGLGGWVGLGSGKDGGRRLRGSPLGGGSGEAGAHLLLRVGACADGPHLMGREREVRPPGPSGAGEGWGSKAKNQSRAWVPPLMGRMCAKPCGEGANWTTHLVERGGHLSVLSGYLSSGSFRGHERIWA